MDSFNWLYEVGHAEYPDSDFEIQNLKVGGKMELRRTI
jgi:hypothetical protein